MLSEKGTRKIVAVIGDIMIDRYLTGRVDRISPEAPVPVLLHSHDRAVAGGAANVAVNIVALGCEVKLVGAVGNDQDAEDLRRILAEAGVSTTLLVTDHSRPTISKTRVVSGRQQFFSELTESFQGGYPRKPRTISSGRLVLRSRKLKSSCSRIMPKASSATMCSSK
jgi:rfaE bifunctional protein kinase chain/domain